MPLRRSTVTNNWRLQLRLAYRLVVTAASMPALGVAVLAMVGDAEAPGRALLTVMAVLIASVAIAVWLPYAISTYVQLVALPIIVGVYLFELTRTDPIDQMLHVEKFWQLVKARRAAGTPVTIQHSPSNFLEGNGTLALGDGRSVLPLAGVPDLPTIMCREGLRPFAEYVADEHGFNNPKGLWQKPVDLAFIGDSMTYGACLPERDHFIGQIRARHPATLNLSNGGIGPLFYLAIAREFLSAVRPKYVFYMYDENNDLYFVNVPGRGDLIAEYGHSILRRYLEDDGFSQRTMERRQEIDDALRQLVDAKIVAGLGARTLGKRVAKLLGLSMTRAGLRPPAAAPTDPLGPQQVEALPAALHAQAARPHRPLAQQGGAQAPQTAVPDYLAIFRMAFAKTIRVAEAAGAKLVFVNIPAQATVCDGATHAWKKPVLDFVAQTGVDTIDLEKDFRNAILQHGREQVFAVPPCGGHFSELGYKAIGDRLLQYLELEDARKGGELADAPGWSYRERDGGGRQLVYSGGDLSEPELLAARRGDAERWRRQRPNVVSRAVAGAADWATARLATRMVFRHQQTYTSDAYVDRPIKTDGSVVVDRDGAAIMGYSWVPKAETSIVRVRVAVPAWSEAENSIVVALFSAGQPEPVALRKRRLVPHRAGAASIDLEIATRPGEALDLSVRVAPGAADTVYLNSNRTPPIPDLAQPTLTIEEYAPFWHR